MTTQTLQTPAQLPTTSPRGARWAAMAALGLNRAAGAVGAWLHAIGQRRARQALLELARSVEARQPSYAQDLRAAAGFPGAR